MKGPTFTKPNNVFESRVNELFQRKDGESNQIIRLVSIILSDGAENTDLIDTFNLLGLENFVKLVHLFEDRTVKFPTTTEIHDKIILAFCYYYKEVEKKKWEEIQAILPFDISAISYGSQVKKLTKSVKAKIVELMVREMNKEKKP